MNSAERREDIVRLLLERNKPVKGSTIATKYSVTRQVIVKDIAILRAKGNNIIATPDGYIMNTTNNRVRAIIAVNHKEEDMMNEIEIVLKYGGVVEDVIVEHPLYGEIKGMLMVSNYNELEKFIDKYENRWSFSITKKYVYPSDIRFIKYFMYYTEAYHSAKW